MATPASVHTSGVGDLPLNVFPVPLQPIIAKINLAVRAAQTTRDRTQRGAPENVKAPATAAFIAVRAAQALLGGTGRQLLQQLVQVQEQEVGPQYRIKPRIGG